MLTPIRKKFKILFLIENQKFLNDGTENENIFEGNTTANLAAIKKALKSFFVLRKLRFFFKINTKAEPFAQNRRFVKTINTSSFSFIVDTVFEPFDLLVLQY